MSAIRRTLVPAAALLAVLPAPAALAAPHWSSPRQVVPKPPEAERTVGAPQALIAADGSLRGFGSDGAYPITLSGTVAGGLTSTRLSTTSTGTARGAIGPDGTLAATWSDTARAFAVTAPGGGAFGGPFALPGARVGSADAAVGSDGVTTVIWRSREADGNYQALVAQAPPGGALGAPQVLDAGTSPVSSVDAAAGPNGAVGVAYTRQAGGYRVKTSLKPAGAAAFETPQTVSDGGQTDMRPELAFNADGTAVVAWANPQGAKAAFRRPGQTAFEAPAAVGGAGYNLALAPTPQGGAALAYVGDGSVHAAVQAPGGGFSAAAAIAPAPGQIPPAPSVATDAAGTTMVAYADAPSGEVRVVTLGGGTTQIGYGAAGVLTPVSLASAGVNRAVALWRDGDGGLSAATFGEDAPVNTGLGPKPAGPDRAAPKVKLRGGTTLRATSRTTTVKLTLTLSERAAIGVMGDLRTTRAGRKRVAPLPTIDVRTAKLRSAGRQTITLKLGRTATADLRRALRARRGGQLFLRVSARDAANNTSETRIRLTIKAKPKKRSR
ncbi:MAG: hypothetical protein JHD16_01045 [Solirubrobacteraceae bacterium]|nr:hypothetical protein [Solirubrobacteraceae bacterium]